MADAASALDGRWDEKFEVVRLFFEEHRRWPKQSEGALGMWCNNQRTAKKGKGKGTHRISPAQIAKLDGIRFDWGTTRTPWDENFEAVRRFRDEHGRWPKAREGALGMWCQAQRNKKKGQGGRWISPAQIAKLDSISFDWGRTRTPEETVELAGPAAGPQHAEAGEEGQQGPQNLADADCEAGRDHI